ncbi:hypothetical protein JB92DRAFT_2833519 [Gautieria morchelliformis]|nr:hypothetical protein JB92DRAFT_2833519 [Gautieria morchelliformis]
MNKAWKCRRGNGVTVPGACSFPTISQTCRDAAALVFLALHPCTHTVYAHTHTPNRAIELDPALRDVLDDVELSLATSNQEGAAVGERARGHGGSSTKGDDAGEGLRQVRHTELEALEADGDEEVDMNARAYEEDRDDDPAHDPFPSTERKSLATSYGSRDIGAVVLRFDLERATLHLISESDKPRLHANADRLFFPRSPGVLQGPPRLPHAPVLCHPLRPRARFPAQHLPARLPPARDATAFAAVVLPAQYAVLHSVLDGVAERLAPEWAGGVERLSSGGVARARACAHTFQKETPAEHAPDGDALETAAADAMETIVL